MELEIIKIANAFISTIENPVVVLNGDLNIITVNSPFLVKFNIKQEKIQNKPFFKIKNKQWDIPLLRNTLMEIKKQKNLKETTLNCRLESSNNKALIISIREIKIIPGFPDFLVLIIKEETDLNQTKKRLDLSNKEIKVRNQISEEFSNTSDDKVYDNVLQIILDILDSDIGYFGYINEEGALVSPSLTRKVWHKCEMPEKDIVFPKEQWGGVFGESLKQEKTIIKNEGLNPPQGHIPLENALCVPILYQGKLIGQIVVGNKNSDYNENDKHVLEGLAKQISPILNARLERDRKEEQKKSIESKLKATRREEVLDFIDKQILNQLYTDGKMSLNKIKQYVVKKNGEHMSHTGINNRIDKLIDSNILKVQGNINITELEYQAAMVLIELKNYRQLDPYINHIKGCPKIILLAKMAGKYHLLFLIIGKSMEEINIGLNHCNIINNQNIKSSNIAFIPKFFISKYTPINLFKNISKENKMKEKCIKCEIFNNGNCNGCGL